MGNITDIDRLLNTGQLNEALTLIQSTLITKSEPVKYIYPLINKLVSLALAKNDVGLAASAAIYTTTNFRLGPVPADASWHHIIEKAMRQGGFTSLPIPFVLLEPKPFNASITAAPAELHALAYQLWQNVKNNEWTLPGGEVKFDAYSNGWSVPNPVLAYKVDEIRGKDFILGFKAVQGKLDTEQYKNVDNIADFNFIAVPGFILKFYEDKSGPLLYKYIGKKDWSEIMPALNANSGFSKINPEWDVINFSDPEPNKKDNMRYDPKLMPHKFGRGMKEHYVKEAVLFMQHILTAKVLNHDIGTLRKTV